MMLLLVKTNVLHLFTSSLDLPAAERCHEPRDSPSFSLDHQLFLLLLLLPVYSCDRRKYSENFVLFKKKKKESPDEQGSIYV